MIQLTQAEYDKLLYATKELSALQEAGVDNWEGYSHAMDILNGLDDFEEEESECL
jgi:hypothetical protein